ncbi:MAG: OsmC family protein [Betaproteobacteria bacterium]|nr:OsmC family protein [Betaproteobacteria bacterium]
MSDPSQVILEQQQDYRFAIHFGVEEGQIPPGLTLPLLIADESRPLGGGMGPTPTQLLVAAVANCMSASLLFALRKFKQRPEPLRAEGRADTGRNEAGRLRVQTIHITLRLGVPAADLLHLDRVLEQFEEFCTVGQSVAQGIPVQITVMDSLGALLKSSPMLMS